MSPKSTRKLQTFLFEMNKSQSRPNLYLYNLSLGKYKSQPFTSIHLSTKRSAQTVQAYLVSKSTIDSRDQVKMTFQKECLKTEVKFVQWVDFNQDGCVPKKNKTAQSGQAHSEQPFSSPNVWQSRSCEGFGERLSKASVCLSANRMEIPKFKLKCCSLTRNALLFFFIEHVNAFTFFDNVWLGND